MSQKIQPNISEAAVLNNFLYEQDMVDMTAERNEQIAEAVDAELFQPLYEFAGVLAPDGTHRRYTRRIQR